MGSGLLLVIMLLVIESLPNAIYFVMCAECNKIPFPNIVVDTSLSIPPFLEITNIEQTTCIKECKNRKKCKTFNYKKTTKNCGLFDVVGDIHNLISVNDTVLSDIDTWPDAFAGNCAGNTCGVEELCISAVDGYECQIVCPVPPSVSNGTVYYDASITSFQVGAILNYSCDPAFYKRGVLQCMSNQTWETVSCNKITTCNEILHNCNVGYSHTEYWMYAGSENNTLLKVYCHGTNEFITLPAPNYEVIPGSDDSDCRIDRLSGACGTTKHKKIKINLTGGNIELVPNNQEFAQHQNCNPSGTVLRYAVAASCGLKTDCSVNDTGVSFLNTTGTGLIIDPETTWTATGPSSVINITQGDDLRSMTITCNGACGDCSYNNQLHFIFNPNETIPLSDAILPMCDLIN